VTKNKDIPEIKEIFSINNGTDDLFLKVGIKEKIYVSVAGMIW